LDRPSGRQILESDTASTPEALASRRDALKKLGVVFKSIVQPVVLAFEADKDASGLAMPSDEDLFGLRQTQKPR
jgi:hypothetical protein